MRKKLVLVMFMLFILLAGTMSYGYNYSSYGNYSNSKYYNTYSNTKSNSSSLISTYNTTGDTNSLISTNTVSQTNGEYQLITIVL